MFDFVENQNRILKKCRRQTLKHIANQKKNSNTCDTQNYFCSI